MRAPLAAQRIMLDEVRKEEDVQRESMAADALAQQRRRKPDKVSLAVKVQRKGVLEEPLLPGDCAPLRCGSGAAAALANLCWLAAASGLAQAFLECEPHRRETSEAYLMRYQTFAKQELEAALTQFESAEQSGGAGWADAVAAAQMPLLVADSRLAKDNLTAALRLNAERIKRRQEALLAGENVASAYRPDEDPCKPAWQQPMP
eukprot:jgi/Astpho2/4598/Aster-x1220